MRIESILESMNLDDKNNKLNIPVFRNPPILKGFESKLNSINSRDKLKKKEKITNTLIKKDGDNKYYNSLKNDAILVIRAPPNFLY